MYSVISSNKYAKQILAGLKGKNIIFVKNDDFTDSTIDIALLEAARVNSDVLILDITGLANELVISLRKFRVSRPQTRIIVFAPGREPGDFVISNIVKMGIYDILAPQLREDTAEEEDDIYNGNLIISCIQNAINRNPALYSEAVRWDVLNDIGTLGTERQKTVEVKNVYKAPDDYIKKVGFIGHNGAGCSSLICWIGNLLSKYNVRVSILDLTNDRDLFEIYPFNDDDVSEQVKHSLVNLNKGIIYPYKINKYLALYTSSFDTQLSIDDPLYILQILEQDNDVILIDMDYNTPLPLLQLLNNVFIVQTLDAKKLKFNTEFLLKLKDSIAIKKVKFIINKIVDCGVSPKDIYECLKVHINLDNLEHTTIIESNVDYLTVPYDHAGQIYSYENDYDISKLSDDFKKAIQIIAHSIYPVVDAPEKKGLLNSLINKFHK